MQNLPVVHLSGSPRNRGRAHGEALRQPIVEIRQRWRASLSARFGVHPDVFIATLLAENHFVDAMRRFSPSLLEEVEGIAEGSGRPIAETLAFQFMDEEWWFGAKRFGAGARQLDRCSVIASRTAEGHPPILAQNMDLRAYHDGGQAVLRIIDDRAEDRAANLTILTICGMVALCGANDLGLGVAVNTLWQLPSSSEGLPVACVVRGLLAQRSLSEAATWIAATPHASGQHYMLGDADGFASFEASGKSVKEVSWDASSPNFVHTNHPISGDGGSARHLAAEENSRGRYQMLCELAGAKTFDVAQVQSALADRGGPHPISVRPNAGDDAGMMTFASIIMELRRPPRIMIAAGPPCSNPYIRIAE
jgi:isopenicillin-N N-acyltransferase-like protein